MPGVKSLSEQQYYAHPHNRFWKVMGILCGCGGDFNKESYKKRTEKLLENGFALWDVIEECKREGSLDSAIKNDIPNDIKKLLNTNPDIKTICLNGNKAYSAFKKYFPEIISDKRYSIYKLPSTSPANARFRLEDLIREWKKIL